MVCLQYDQCLLVKIINCQTAEIIVLDKMSWYMHKQIISPSFCKLKYSPQSITINSSLMRHWCSVAKDSQVSGWPTYAVLAFISAASHKNNASRVTGLTQSKQRDTTTNRFLETDFPQLLNLATELLLKNMTSFQQCHVHVRVTGTTIEAVSWHWQTTDHGKLASPTWRPLSTMKPLLLNYRMSQV